MTVKPGHRIDFPLSDKFSTSDDAKKACLDHEECTGFYFYNNEYVLASGLDLVEDADSISFYLGSKNLNIRVIGECNTDQCHNCFSGNGESYRGMNKKSFNGKNCLTWEKADPTLYTSEFKNKLDYLYSHYFVKQKNYIMPLIRHKFLYLAKQSSVSV